MTATVFSTLSGKLVGKHPEWRGKEKIRVREAMRKKRQDPEYRKKEAEKQRERRAKKKAEQEARSS